MTSKNSRNGSVSEVLIGVGQKFDGTCGAILLKLSIFIFINVCDSEKKLSFWKVLLLSLIPFLTKVISKKWLMLEGIG